MAKRKKNGLNANDLTIAKAVAGEKYDPQIASIKGLYGQAGQQLASDITAAKAGAKSAVVYSKAARPTVKGDYGAATKTVNQDAKDTLAAFGTIGQAADIFRGAAAREHDDYKSRIASEKVAALQELTDRATSAQAGKAFAVNKARQDYKDTTATLGQQLSSLYGAKGDSMAAQLGTLMQQRADRSTKIKTAKIQAGAGDNKVIQSGAFQGMTNAEVRAMTPAAKAQAVAKYNAQQHPGGGSGGRAKAPDQVKLSNSFNKAYSLARSYAGSVHPAKLSNGKPDPRAGKPFTRQELARMLMQGGPARKQPDGSVTPAVQSVDQFPLSLALDMAFDKHISRQNAQYLHDHGYKVSDLRNAVPYSQWAQQQKRKPKRSAAKPNVFNTNPFTGAPLAP